jgi:hypothetical protein
VYQVTKKLLTLLPMIGLVVALQACEQSGASSTGGGSSSAQVVELTDEKSAALVEGAELIADAENPGDEPEDMTASAAVAKLAAAATENEPRGEFHLLFDQSLMACPACGLNFDSAELIIEHSAGRFKAYQSGSLLIKKGPYRQGRFRADISSIPPEAEIHSAILNMRLNKHEGIASVDHSSEYVVKGYVDGSLIHVKDFNVQRDIKGRGYSKGMNPVVPFDFTSYARKL